MEKNQDIFTITVLYYTAVKKTTNTYGSIQLSRVLIDHSRFGDNNKVYEGIISSSSSECMILTMFELVVLHQGVLNHHLQYHQF